MGKKILVVEESGFALICRSLLNLLGYQADEVCDPAKEPPEGFDLHSYALLITSYPFGSSYLSHAKRARKPVILMSNCVSPELVEEINDFDNLHCLIKPINFENFFQLVQGKVDGTLVPEGGYTIV